MIVRCPGFSYEFDEQVVPQDLGEDFAAGFETMDLQEGQTVQVGWMMLSVVAGPEGLELHEPDMSGETPINFIPGITRTLRDTMVQRYVTDSLGLTEYLDFPTLVQSVITCDRIQPGGALFFTRPDHQEGHASGWVCCCCDKSHDHNDPAALTLTSLYDLGCRHPILVEFLALPVGSAVILVPGQNPAFYYGDQALDILPDSYLAAQLGLT